MSGEDNQFTSISIREKIQTKMIGLVESLLNEKDIRANSRSHEIEEAAKQDDFFFVQTIKNVKQSAAKHLKRFLDASSQRHVNASCFTHKALFRQSPCGLLQRFDFIQRSLLRTLRKDFISNFLQN